VTELVADIRKSISEWNKNPKPFVWTKTADQILETLPPTASELTTQDTTRRECRRPASTPHA
jgi:hypothetical protein